MIANLDCHLHYQDCINNNSIKMDPNVVILSSKKLQDK